MLSKYGCEGELVKIDCDTSLVIDIVRANYGRLSPQVCAPLANQEGSGQDCLHRSSKAVLDRQCAGKHSCLVRASADVFHNSECPLVTKYLEVHYRCVEDRAGQRKELVPPWLEDLHATFSPVVRHRAVTSSTTTTVETSEDVNDNNVTNDDEEHGTVISEAPQPSENGSKHHHQAANSQGRYFLIHDNSGESDSSKDGDDGVTTLIISVTISIVSTILSIIIFVHICRKVRGKTISGGTSDGNDQACYECHPISGGGEYQYQVSSNKLDSIPYQADSNKINSIPVIPIQANLFVSLNFLKST